MDEMNTAELLVEEVRENQTRKIIAIFDKCETLEEFKEALEKVKALLNK